MGSFIPTEAFCWLKEFFFENSSRQLELHNSARANVPFVRTN